MQFAIALVFGSLGFVAFGLPIYFGDDFADCCRVEISVLLLNSGLKLLSVHKQMGGMRCFALIIGIVF